MPPGRPVGRDFPDAHPPVGRIEIRREVAGEHQALLSLDRAVHPIGRSLAAETKDAQGTMDAPYRWEDLVAERARLGVIERAELHLAGKGVKHSAVAEVGDSPARGRLVLDRIHTHVRWRRGD